MARTLRAAALLFAATLASTASAQSLVYITAGPGEDFGPDSVRVSRDGRFAVGCGTLGLGSVGFYYDINFVSLVNLPGGANTYGLCINADGTVVGGDSGASGLSRNGAAWTVSGGTISPAVTLSDLAGGITLARALATNDAGTLFAGYGSVSGAVQACTWTYNPGTGAASAPTNISAALPADSATSKRSRVEAMSGNGNVMAGFYSRATGGDRAFARVGTTFTGLNDPQGDADVSSAFGISRDGSTIVGFSGSDAVAWRLTGGVYLPSALPQLVAGSVANAANADGSVIVGDSGEAVVWRSGQVQSLAAILATANVSLLGLQLVSATDVSDDGLTVVGIAHDPAANGLDYGFVATLPPILQPNCPADIGITGGVPGSDGVLDNNDFVVFIDYFFNQNPTADVGSVGGVPGSDGQFDNNDFIVFIDQFFAGC
jgi:uncharacterized membrane protein